MNERILEQMIKRMDPSQIYFPTDLDTAGSTQYFGFMATTGYWYIMQVTATTVRYFSDGTGDGFSTYATNWTNRATLSYVYPSATVIK